MPYSTQEDVNSTLYLRLYTNTCNTCEGSFWMAGSYRTNLGEKGYILWVIENIQFFPPHRQLEHVLSVPSPQTYSPRVKLTGLHDSKWKRSLAHWNLQSSLLWQGDVQPCRRECIHTMHISKVNIQLKCEEYMYEPKVHTLVCVTDTDSVCVGTGRTTTAGEMLGVKRRETCTS